MSRTPTDRIVARLRAREADRATRDAAIQAARDAYEAKWSPEVSQLLDDAAALAGVDERPPEPKRAKREKPPPSTTSSPGGETPIPDAEVDRLLALTVPELAKVAMPPMHARQLLAAAEAAGKAGHAAHLQGRL